MYSCSVRQSSFEISCHRLISKEISRAEHSGVSLEAGNRRFPPATFNITVGYFISGILIFSFNIEFKLVHFDKNYNIKYFVLRAFITSVTGM